MNVLKEKVTAGCRRLGSLIKKKLPEILAVLVCAAALCNFVSMKQGWHMDEMLSFELANAEYNPWITPLQPEGRLAKFVRNEIDGATLSETLDHLADTVVDVLKNRGDSKMLSYKADVYDEPVWITAQQFRDYIQVDREDDFNYLSVYFNVKDDNHPPLYFMAVHTVSSVFKGKAEPWMGCLINLIAVIMVTVLLMKLGVVLAEAFGLKFGRQIGILCAVLYGLSAGAIATTLLIRMYGMLTLWCVLYFCLVLHKWQKKEFDRRNFRLILVTMLGFWTQYFFLFYCMVLAAVICVLLLRGRRMRELWRFVRSMLAAAVAGVAVFPFAVSDVLSSGRGVEALGNLAAGFSGYGTRLAAFMGILFNRTFFPLFWILLLVLAVLAVCLVRRTPRADGAVSEGEGRGKPVFWMLVLPPVGYFLLAARMSPYLVDRYIMPLFPFVILWGVLALAALFGICEKRMSAERGKRLGQAVFLGALLLQFAGVFRYDGSYLYRGYDQQLTAARYFQDYPCICIYDGVGYYENLQEFTYYPQTLLLTIDQLEGRQDTESIRELEAVSVLIKESAAYDVNQVVEIMEQYGFKTDMLGWRGLSPHDDFLVFMRKDV